MSSANRTAKPLLGTASERVRKSLGVNHSRLVMKVIVAPEEPRTWAVGAEADRNVIRLTADTDHVALRRVGVVVRRLAGTANDVKRVTVQMD
jgi:hypothetical protein